jgi:hypothetical protein
MECPSSKTLLVQLSKYAYVRPQRLRVAWIKIWPQHSSSASVDSLNSITSNWVVIRSLNNVLAARASYVCNTKSIFFPLYYIRLPRGGCPCGTPWCIVGIEPWRAKIVSPINHSQDHDQDAILDASNYRSIMFFSWYLCSSHLSFERVSVYFFHNRLSKHSKHWFKEEAWILTLVHSLKNSKGYLLSR